MERKNTILLTVIAIATLLVAVVGATFAYFTATIQDDRTAGSGQGETKVTAGSVASETIVANVDNAAGKFTATDVYPGHVEVAALSVTAKSDTNAPVKINIKYNVTTNNLGTHVKVYVMKSDTPITTTATQFSCDKQVTGTETVQYSETCSGWTNATTNNLTGASQVGTTTTLKGNAEEVVLASDTITGAEDPGKTAYYYIVVEYTNDDEQNAEMGQSLEGKVSVELAA